MGFDRFQRRKEISPKIPDALVALPELLVQGHPGDELAPLGVHPMQALRQPAIPIQPHGGMGQGDDRPFVERDGVLLQAGEVIRAQLDLYWEIKTALGRTARPTVRTR